MALSDPSGGGTGAISRVANGSVQSWWQLAHSNAKATAETETASPFKIDQEGSFLVKVPQGAVRAYLRLRWTAGGTVTTAPVVSVYGYGDFDAATKKIPANGDTVPERLASVRTVPGTKIVDNDDGTTDTFDYGASVFATDAEGPDVEGDLRGASWIQVACTTAAAGPDAVQIEVKFLN